MTSLRIDDAYESCDDNGLVADEHAVRHMNADDLADALGVFRPTAQQRSVIEAPLAPTLVVAGAGSGKTETMASRVVWLVANGLVRPEQILGLTFTRKAAGELEERIQKRIDQLRSRELICGRPGDTNTPDFLNVPTISTYNSFAHSIVRDHGLLVGVENDAVVLDESSAWGIARDVVVTRGDDRLARCGRSIDVIAGAVLTLAREMTENEASAQDCERLVSEFAYLADLPYSDDGRKKTPYVSVVAALEVVGSFPVLFELAEGYNLEKKSRGLLDYSDQVALAHTIVTASSSVADEYRDRFSVVLLDEYQDTSVPQTALLATLFRERSVMAVGDPHQAIYGWRGASASNMASFLSDFTENRNHEIWGAQRELTTSWRNDTMILAAANRVLEPLRASTPVVVSELSAKPNASAGSVEVRFAETRNDECVDVAEILDAALKEPKADSSRRSAAILFRTRAHMAHFAAALEARGIPHHTLGLGGLLATPEVLDMVCAFRVIHDPRAGSALIRLLTGGRWRIGVRDLAQLRELASWLHSRDGSQQLLSGDVRERVRSSFVDEEEASLVEALDFLACVPQNHSCFAAFSVDGRERLRDAAATFARLRSRSRMGLIELSYVIEAELRLDIELLANERNARVRDATRQLDVFREHITSFLAGDRHGSLARLVRWLDRAERNDDLALVSDDPEPGTVQLLTIHGAKGLEWDIVVVPRCVDDELPSASREGSGWLRFGRFPDELRKDAASLPQLAWRNHATQRDFDAAYHDFRDRLRERHENEERRLMYVAVTRAREHLVLTGSFWSTGKQQRSPSRYLYELAEAGIVSFPRQESAFAENPLADSEVTTQWPRDPLGGRRRVVEAAALCVRAGDSDGPGLYEREIDLLLAERHRDDNRDVSIPTRISASRFKDYLENRDKTIAARMRPLPQRPYGGARRGTFFHSWIENRSTVRATPELLSTWDVDRSSFSESDEGERKFFDHVDNDADMARLKEIFEASEWATRRPEHTELEIHMALDNHVVVCKLDAVYGHDNGRFEIVDWKTGASPRDERDAELKNLQLALYREAFAQWKGIDVALIDVAFFYIGENRVIRPKNLPSLSELRQAWQGVISTR